MLLKPFRIRNLFHQFPERIDQSVVVQLSGEDYDDLAQSASLARLTYVDLDDGDTITVGLISYILLPRTNHSHIYSGWFLSGA
jgi:hypothetical protein